MDNEINNLQNENATVNRPSKSGVPRSSRGGPTKESAGCGSCATRQPAENDSRGCLNAGRTLADKSDQVKLLREMADKAKASVRACREEGFRSLADEEQSRCEIFTAAAEAIERERWCEERKAEVYWHPLRREWCVTVRFCDLPEILAFSPDRNAAIDSARGVR